MAVHRRRGLRLVLLLLAVAVVAGLGILGYRYLFSPPAPDGVIVVDQEPGDVPGYDRACGAGEGCVFGPAWSDDVTVRLGHNGCDTRNDILAEQLINVTYIPSTNNCVVLSGALNDPYTGGRVEFTKVDAAQVQIDHVYPLAAAWDRGAWQWTADRRRDFANDPDNLTATSASAKSEQVGQDASAMAASLPARAMRVPREVHQCGPQVPPADHDPGCPGHRNLRLTLYFYPQSFNGQGVGCSTVDFMRITHPGMRQLRAVVLRWQPAERLPSHIAA